MKNGAKTNNVEGPARWGQLDENIKLLGLGALGITAATVMTVFGPQALYLIIGTVALGTFVIYPEVEPERVIWGAAIGGIVAGPLGMIVGAGVGHYLGKKYDAFMRWANPVAQAASTAFNAITSATVPLIKGANKTASVINQTASAIDDTKKGFFSTVSKGIGYVQSAAMTISNAFNDTETIEAAPSVPSEPLQTQPLTAVDPQEKKEAEELRNAILKEQSKPLQFTEKDNQTKSTNTKKTSWFGFEFTCEPEPRSRKRWECTTIM